MSENKVQFQFAIPKELDADFRVYVAQKYGGYHKGDLSKEVEDLIRYRLEKQEDSATKLNIRKLEVEGLARQGPTNYIEPESRRLKQKDDRQ